MIVSRKGREMSLLIRIELAKQIQIENIKQDNLGYDIHLIKRKMLKTIEYKEVSNQ